MLTLLEFQQQLANCTSTEQISNFIRTFNVSAYNTTDASISVFYTKSIDGNPNNPMWQIANAIQAEGNGAYKVLNTSTDAAVYLGDNDYRELIINRLSFITNIQDENLLKSQFFNGYMDGNVYKPGYWDIVSEKMAQQAKGNVIALVPFSGVDEAGNFITSADNSVWAKTELPALLQNENVTHINGIPKETLLSSFSRGGIDAVFNDIRITSYNQFIASGLVNWSSASSVNLNEFLNEATQDLNQYLINHSEALERAKNYNEILRTTRPEIYELYQQKTNLLWETHVTTATNGTKFFNKLGIIGITASLLMVAGQAGAAELSGDHEGAKNIIKDWAIDASGSLAGELIGGAVAGIVGTALVAGGVISAPVSGALILAGALIGGIYGGDAAKDLYELTKDKDSDGKRDLYNRIINLMYGATEFKITDPLVANINGGTQYTLEANFTRDEIVQQAKESMAWRYALFALNPFVITDIDYSRHNTNSNLDLYNPDTGKGMTEQYLKAA